MKLFLMVLLVGVSTTAVIGFGGIIRGIVALLSMAIRAMVRLIKGGVRIIGKTVGKLRKLPHMRPNVRPDGRPNVRPRPPKPLRPNPKPTVIRASVPAQVRKDIAEKLQEHTHDLLTDLVENLNMTSDLANRPPRPRPPSPRPRPSSPRMRPPSPRTRPPSPQPKPTPRPSRPSPPQDGSTRPTPRKWNKESIDKMFEKFQKVVGFTKRMSLADCKLFGKDIADVVEELDNSTNEEENNNNNDTTQADDEENVVDAVLGEHKKDMKRLREEFTYCMNKYKTDDEENLVTESFDMQDL